MILLSKTSKKLPAFTLIEVLVSLTIISIAILSTITVFSGLSREVKADDQEKEIYSLMESKMVSYAIADNLKHQIFSKEELVFLNTNKQWPLFTPLIRTNIGSHSLLISRKVRRWNPLLVDVGMEAVFRYQGISTNMRIRHYWVESTFSETINRLYK